MLLQDLGPVLQETTVLFNKGSHTPGAPLCSFPPEAGGVWDQVMLFHLLLQTEKQGDQTYAPFLHVPLVEATLYWRLWGNNEVDYGENQKKAISWHYRGGLYKQPPLILLSNSTLSCLAIFRYPICARICPFSIDALEDSK